MTNVVLSSRRASRAHLQRITRRNLCECEQGKKGTDEFEFCLGSESLQESKGQRSAQPFTAVGFHIKVVNTINIMDEVRFHSMTFLYLHAWNFCLFTYIYLRL